MVGVRADPGTGSASQPAGRPGSGELPGISVGSAPGPGPVLPASDETLHRRRPGRWILRINRWRRYGHDRLYVQDDFGNAVGWWDLATGTAHEVERGWEAAVAESVESWIARYGAGVSAGARPVPNAPTRVPPPPPVHMAPVVPLTDLAETLPGEQILDLAFAGGWRSSWGGDCLMVNGQRLPYVPAARSEGRKASRLLSRACRFEVSVSPLVVIVGRPRLQIKELTTAADETLSQNRPVAHFGWSS